MWILLIICRSAYRHNLAFDPVCDASHYSAGTARCISLCTSTSSKLGTIGWLRGGLEVETDGPACRAEKHKEFVEEVLPFVVPAQTV